MIYDLLLTFTGPQGCDSTGVPLLNIDRILGHPADVQLYTKTG